jgi:uncharacterized protein (DUF488 family)
MSKKLFTIGHSNLSLEDFIALLQKYEVTAIADVRSHPYSRYLPHFNQTELKIEFLKANISYVFLGNELGARPKNLSCYINDQAVYQKIAATRLFVAGIQRVFSGSKKYQIALMCSEQDPITCHRTILICQHLKQFNLDINHILSNGNLESHLQLENRLLELHGFDINKNQLKSEEIIQFNIFEQYSNDLKSSIVSKEEFLKQAYIEQGNKIAYVKKK